MSDIMKFSPLWGEWNIKEVVGKGTNGTVYRALREEYGQTYVSAIKHIQIPPENTTGIDLVAEGVVASEAELPQYYDRVRDKLLNEITTMYELRGNSNFVSYEEHKIVPRENQSGYDIFIRMEYLLSLPKYMSMHPMSEADVVKLGINICNGLDMLEKHKIVHRDIKTSNIFVNSDGTYKIGDFGESADFASAYGTTSVRGTLSFMPPEVSRGESFNNTTDIYSLGMVMYRLLNNNRAPFMPLPPQNVTNEMLEQSNKRRLSGEVMPAPSQCGATLASIVLTACSPLPSGRFQSAFAFGNALKQYSQTNANETVLDEDKTVSAFTANQSSQYGGIGSQTTVPPISGVSEYGGRPTMPESKEKKRSSAMIALIAVMCVLLAGILTALGVFAFSSMQKDDSESSSASEVSDDEKSKDEETVSETTEQITTAKQLVWVPSVEGLSYEEARSALKDLGLKVKRESTDSVRPRDEVVEQKTAEGKEVEPGTEITLVVAQNPGYEQKIVVKETGGNSSATLKLYNLGEKGWEEIGSYNAKVGKEGVGLNYGENSTQTPQSGDDGFALGFVMGAQAPYNSNIDFYYVTSSTCMVCDPNSSMYNTIRDMYSVPGGVAVDKIGEKLTVKGTNNYCIFIEHNGNGYTSDNVVSGKGSVITICGCYDAISPTYGCIDISASDMNDLISKLDYSLSPRIIIK